MHKRTLSPLKSLIYGLRRYDLDRAVAQANSSDPGFDEKKITGFMSHKSKIYLVSFLSRWSENVETWGRLTDGWLVGRRHGSHGVHPRIVGNVREHHGELDCVYVQHCLVRHEHNYVGFHFRSISPRSSADNASHFILRFYLRLSMTASSYSSTRTGVHSL